MHKTIKWKGIGNVQVTTSPKRLNTYYYVGKLYTVEWWYDVHTRNWTIYIINGLSGDQLGDARCIHNKAEVAPVVNQLANGD